MPYHKVNMIVSEGVKMEEAVRVVGKHQQMIIEGLVLNASLR